jgi:hyperosmotically inducible protein
MIRFPYTLMVLVLSMFFLAAGSQVAKADLADTALDTKITTSVKGHLAKDDKLKTLTQISVKTTDKTVYLTGEVPTQQEKERAGEVAQKVEHVKKVVNDIKVKP